MFSSLRSRLLATHILIALSAIALLGVLALAAASPITRQLTFQRLADQIGPIILSGRNPAFAPDEIRPRNDQAGLDRLRALSARQDLRVLLVDRGSQAVLFDSRDTLAGQRWTLPLGPDEMERNRSWLPERRHRDAPSARGFARLGDDTWLYVALPLAEAPGRFLVIMQPSPPPVAAARILLQTLPPVLSLLTLALLIGFVILLSIWVTRSVTSSLAPVTAATHQIAAGNLEYRVPIQATTLQEFRTLAEDFNRMADQVQGSRQAQRDFIANVSHDLKTPLTSLRGFSQALLDGTASTPAARDRAAKIISAEAERMDALVDDLLDLVRLDTARLDLRPADMDLAPYLATLVDDLRPRATEAGLHLRWEEPEGPLPVRADGDRLARAFHNLLDNAMEHTPTGGVITVRGRRQPQGDGTWVRVEISDTGSGIPPADLPHLFDRFYQVEKARSGKRGAGLGLAIVREMVAAHGGQVGVESEMGRGSTFWITLPERPAA